MKLVSAILPTRGRSEWALKAVECFAAQTYQNKELIILDDIDDRSFPDGVQDLSLRLNIRIIYALHGSRSIPQKRNICCRLAKGEIIATWDSDDYSAPERLSLQVKQLDESGRRVCGFYSMYFHAEASGLWWRYCADASYAIGTSLCYTREWYDAHPFNESLEIGEDNHFVTMAKHAGELISTDCGGMMFARIHNQNTSPKKVDATQYRRIPVEAIPEVFR